MKTIKFASILTLLALLLTLMMVSCGPSYVGTGVGYGPRPYYGSPYGYYRPYGYYGYRPPVIVAPPVVVRPRYYAPAPRVYSAPGARGGFGGGGFGGGRFGSPGSRGPR